MLSLLDVQKIIDKSINEKNENEQNKLSEIIYNFSSSKNKIKKIVIQNDSTLKLLIVEMRKGFEMMEKRFEAVDKRFESMEKRFEAVDKRFDDLIHQMDKRFEAVDKRFEDMNKRFEDMNKRFDDMNKFFKLFLWLFGIGLTITNIMIALKAFK
jgi:predicted RNase H-like nuclease (RuvC/YqgF family)